MAIPTGSTPLKYQRDTTVAPVVTLTTKAVNLAGGVVEGNAAAATYTFTINNDGQEVRDLCDLLERAIRNGSAVVS